MSVQTEEKIEINPPQSEEDQAIANRIRTYFDRFKKDRDKAFTYFRNRNIFQYINDSNARFNNYREKPEWKDDWQSNVSDITTHSKLMAIIAQVVASRLRPEFYSKFQQNIFADFKARLFTDIYDYIDNVERSGDIDALFMTLRAAREGTVIGFEGYKKTKLYDGIDSQTIPLTDFYPSDITKFHMRDQLQCVWRSVIDFTDFKEKYDGWYQADKVKVRGSITTEEVPFFSVSQDLENDQVEILRWFSKFDDEFFVTVNGILITDPKSAGCKLSNRRKDGEMGFWKTVYEPFDDNFFYGRSLPDLMSDNQDAIDFLFNAMFDKEILAVMRPILVGGVNSLTSDYLYPGRQIQVTDVQQIQEMKFDGPDLTAFRILKELQDRQHFVSVDAVSQGVSLGKKTATEVERAQEAAKRIMTLFITMLKDGVKQQARLRVAIIQQFYLKKSKFYPIILRNTKLTSGRFGTKIVRVKGQNELTPKRDSGYSKLLEIENALIKGNSEIWEITPQEIKDFEVEVGVRVPSTTEQSDALNKAFAREFVTVAFARPDVYDQKVVARKFAEIMNQDPEEVMVDETQGMPGQIPGSELANELMPTNKAATPSLKSLIGNI
jgi:hypothetical protein